MSNYVTVAENVAVADAKGNGTKYDVAITVDKDTVTVSGSYSGTLREDKQYDDAGKHVGWAKVATVQALPVSLVFPLADAAMLLAQAAINKLKPSALADAAVVDNALIATEGRQKLDPLYKVIAEALVRSGKLADVLGEAAKGTATEVAKAHASGNKKIRKAYEVLSKQSLF